MWEWKVFVNLRGFGWSRQAGTVEDRGVGLLSAAQKQTPSVAIRRPKSVQRVPISLLVLISAAFPLVADGSGVSSTTERRYLSGTGLGD